MLGGYLIHSQVGKEEMEIFKYAMKDHVGVGFQPIAVASQVVQGVNYIFVCTGKPVVPNPETKLYAVMIYTEFKDSTAPKVEIKAIKEVDVTKLV